MLLLCLHVFTHRHTFRCSSGSQGHSLLLCFPLMIYGVLRAACWSSAWAWQLHGQPELFLAAPARCPLPSNSFPKYTGQLRTSPSFIPGGSRGLITTLQMQQGHAGLIYHRRAAARRLPASLGPAGDCRAYRRAKGQGRLIYHIRNPLSPLREVFCYQSVFQIRNKTSKKPKKKNTIMVQKKQQGK